MVDDATRGLSRLAPQGYDAVRRRFEELKSRFRSPSPPDPGPTPMPGLFGSIGFENEPLDPFASGVRVRAMAAPDAIAGLIRQAASEQGLDSHLLEALVSVESAFDPKAISRAGAQGLAQLMPSTARALGVSDPFDPAQNVNGGARYLAQMLREFGGDVRLALAAYNAGPGAVRRHGGIPPFQETQNYVNRVMDRARALRGEEPGGG